MADNPAFYRQRAAEEHSNAVNAQLDNVRDRCERAAAAWEAMATRYDRVDKHRAEREALVVQRVILADVEP